MEWRRIGVTDHSYGLPIARGMSMEAAVRQHQEIDEVNARFAGRVRVYKGVEANILADGALDLQEDERRVFEYVIAAPHSQLRKAMRIGRALRPPTRHSCVHQNLQQRDTALQLRLQ